MEPGKRIRQRRKELSLTQEQFAEKVFVTPQAVSQWENGHTVPDIDVIPLLAEVLQVDCAELISSTDRDHLSWIIRDQFYSVENMYRKIMEFAENEHLDQTAKAAAFARKMHEGQLRKTSRFSSEPIPYIVHPFIMTCHAHALGIRDDNVLVAVLLHDVCEDCGVKPEDMPFSEEVKTAVSLLTRKKNETAEDHREYYERIAKNEIAAIAKVLDRCNNLSTMMLSFSKEKLADYIDETETYIFPLLDHIKHACPAYYDAVFVIKYQILAVTETCKAALLRF